MLASAWNSPSISIVKIRSILSRDQFSILIFPSSSLSQHSKLDCRSGPHPRHVCKCIHVHTLYIVPQLVFFSRKIRQTRSFDRVWFKDFDQSHIFHIWGILVLSIKFELSLQLKLIQIPVSALLAFLHSCAVCASLSSYASTTISMTPINYGPTTNISCRHYDQKHQLL